MNSIANIAKQGKNAILSQNTKRFVELLDMNFKARQELYGSKVIGMQTLEIISVASAFGHAAKLSGSGGCVIGLYRKHGECSTVQEQKSIRELKKELEQLGYIFCHLQFAE
jgi:glucuronokinase